MSVILEFIFNGYNEAIASANFKYYSSQILLLILKGVLSIFIIILAPPHQLLPCLAPIYSGLNE